MSIIGTPIAPTGIVAIPVVTPSNLVSCVVQQELTPKISKFLGQSIFTRQRAIQVSAGQKVALQWTMIDADGNPVDLSLCGFTAEGTSGTCDPSSSSSSAASSASSVAIEEPTIELRLRETMSVNSACKPLQTAYPGEVTSPGKGEVRFDLPAGATQLPGVYFAEVGALDADGNLLMSNVFTLIINRGMYGADGLTGPPSIAEVRLHLRDNSAEENLLLDHVAFDDAEIALAIARPVQYWNEIPPPVCTYTTQSFPFRYHWLEAICADLFQMVAEQYRRNHLEYAAAGIAVNDQNKAMDYERAAALRRQAWHTFVRAKKASLNLENCYGGIGSQYGGYW